MQPIYKFCFLVFAITATIASCPVGAGAFVQFQMVFKKQCVDSSEHEQFQEICTKARTRCLVCHHGRGGRHLNVYGVQVGKLIGKDDRRNKEKIIEALKKVAELPFDPDDKDSETFGERIAAGKLPGGELEELMKEPPQPSEESKVEAGTAASVEVTESSSESAAGSS